MPWVPWSIGLVLLALLVVWSVWDGFREEKQETEVLSILLVCGNMTARDMAAAGYPLLNRRAVDRVLEHLEREGLVAIKPEFRVVPRREAAPKRYSITELGRTEVLVRAKAKAGAA
ncbi:MAG TPA: hypothetical protein VJN18_32405 [Polyangiaceae bacterium]|nr:hypothetical protein [Polyangiaceae bacterium]